MPAARPRKVAERRLYLERVEATVIDALAGSVRDLQLVNHDPLQEVVMQTNATPTYDLSDNPTGCCPRFNPAPWDGQELHFVEKPFVRASTLSFFHLPLNMNHVFKKTQEAIERAHASSGSFLVLSRDDSPWHAEHLFAVDTDEVPGAHVVHLSGDFLTKVFEGPFSDAPRWAKAMDGFVLEHGKTMEDLYFFYTTCPKCAEFYGKNYVVGVAKVG